MPRSSPSPRTGPMTALRSARLYRLLSMLRGGPKSREQLARGARLDLRGFYRDLKKLRDLGVRLASEGHRYRLIGSFERAISRLPFPDPRLNLHEAIVLAEGASPVHRKLRKQITRITTRQ